MHKHVPYFSDAHCMAHCTNLVMQFEFNKLNFKDWKALGFFVHLLCT